MKNTIFNYWEQILLNRKNPDYIKWILSDKYMGKQFAKYLGFKIAKTLQLVKTTQEINFSNIIKQNNNHFVVKPTDLCDSKGVFLMKNNINLINNKPTTINSIKKELITIQRTNNNNYYMHELMFRFKIPFKGFIIEELLLDENGIPPTDFKCYAFNGRVFLVANTYNRKQEGDAQTFNSIWMTRKGKPLPFKMIKKNYKYTPNYKLPNGYENMINLVENASKHLRRHCRIDVYLINGEVYFGEFTFFGGAFLHTKFANTLLGIKWHINPDKIHSKDNKENDKKLIKIINDKKPSFYN